MTKVNVDFSQIEDSVVKVFPGKYTGKVVDVEKKEGAKAPYFKWTIQLLDGKSKGLYVFHNTSLSPNALFSLRDLLEAFGVDVPKAAVTIDTAQFKGKKLGLVVADREYEGNTYPNVVKVYPASMGGVEDVELPTTDEDDVVLDLD